MNSLSNEELKALLMTVGSHRRQRPLDPIQVGNYFNRLRGAGKSIEECAELVHFQDTTMVSRFMRLETLVPEVQALVSWGLTGTTLSFTSASELARLPSDLQLLAAIAVIEHRFSSSETRQLVQLVYRAKLSIIDAAKSVAKMRPQIVRRHLLIGSVSARHKGFLSQLDQEAKNALLASIVAREYGNSRELELRLTSTNFTISGPAESVSRISDLDALESVVDQALTLESERGPSL